MNFLRSLFLTLAVVIGFTLTSCAVVGGIFKAGMWTAVILIVLVVLLVGWIFSKFRNRS